MSALSTVARDNQWWYSSHPLSRQLDDAEHIILMVDGRRCPMTHSAMGRDGRVTRSFRFDRGPDRDAWVSQRGQPVRIEIELVGPAVGNSDRPTALPTAVDPNSKAAALGQEPLPEEPVQLTPPNLGIRSTDHARIFGAYLFCDWSAANHPKTGPDSTWLADGWFESNGTFVWGVCENPPTRLSAEQLVRDRILFHRHQGRRTLVGFDFPFGYPASALSQIVGRPQANWRDLWQLLTQRIDDSEQNANNRFPLASAINAVLNERWYWGTPTPTDSLLSTKSDRGEVPEFRLVEESLRSSGRRPFSVWQLFGNGSVGSQTLVGLPTCERLRADDQLGLRVWPFETGLAAPSTWTTWNILAEVWPGAIVIDESLHATKDAAQMLSMVRWAAEHDACGTLAPMFEVPSLVQPDRQKIEKIEGWILGWTG